MCLAGWGGETERDWRRLLKVPWASRRSNQSILKEINPEYEGLNLKLKTESETSIFWQPYKKSQLIGKEPDDEKDWRQEEKEMIERERENLSSYKHLMSLIIYNKHLTQYMCNTLLCIWKFSWTYSLLNQIVNVWNVKEQGLTLHFSYKRLYPEEKKSSQNHMLHLS